MNLIVHLIPNSIYYPGVGCYIEDALMQPCSRLLREVIPGLIIYYSAISVKCVIRLFSSQC